MKKKITVFILIAAGLVLTLLFYKTRSAVKKTSGQSAVKQTGFEGITLLNLVADNALGLYPGAPVIVDFEKKGEVKEIEILQDKINIKIIFDEKVKLTEDFNLNIKSDNGGKIEIKNTSNGIFLEDGASVDLEDREWFKRYSPGKMLK